MRTQGYFFQTFEEYIQSPKEKFVILRHDVDRKPGNALVIAKTEKEADIKASYYFRIVKESYDENIIKIIADMGHEIGYHYEDLDLSSRGQKSEVGSQEKIEVGGRPGEIRPSMIFRTYGINFARHLREFHWVKKTEDGRQRTLIRSQRSDIRLQK